MRFPILFPFLCMVMVHQPRVYPCFVVPCVPLPRLDAHVSSFGSSCWNLTAALATHVSIGFDRHPIRRTHHFASIASRVVHWTVAFASLDTQPFTCGFEHHATHQSVVWREGWAPELVCTAKPWCRQDMARWMHSWEVDCHVDRSWSWIPFNTKACQMH